MAITTAKRLRVYERNGFACVDCGRTSTLERVLFLIDQQRHHNRQLSTLEDLTLDHILPLSRGGTDHEDNLQTMCRRCNNRKGARVPEGVTARPRPHAHQPRQDAQARLGRLVARPSAALPFSTFARRVHREACHPVHGCVYGCPVHAMMEHLELQTGS